MQRGVATEVSQRGSDQTYHSGPTPQKAKALVSALHDYVLVLASAAHIHDYVLLRGAWVAGARREAGVSEAGGQLR